MKDFFKSHLLFNRQQRDGILFLITLLIGMIVVNYFIDLSEQSIIDSTSPEIIKLQSEIDSLRTEAINSRRPKVYPFNPNFITDYKAYSLGMSPEEYDRLKVFREGNRWINSVKDFKRVTQVSDSLLARISPYFKFPDWVTRPRLKTNGFKNLNSKKSFSEKQDLNKATVKDLQLIYGIGEVLSNRIVSFREKIGGFSDDIQLYGVWGLEGKIADQVMQNFTVKSPKDLAKMDLNIASASDIATIPSVSFDLAKQIWELRILNERIKDFSELKKIDGMTQYKLKLIKLYLYVD
jgi:DNA uptake protein ComE-like DNA-binding protein